MVSKLALSVLVMTVVLVALSESPKKMCCTRYQKKQVQLNKLKSYVIQEITGYCNMKAVIFRTVKNRWFCADPKKKWVIEAMKSLPK
uniref:Chemokine interleukin-8-like domain-containing protein n=1 Tax=Gouania willdenowi TaxID=441366 RepID=A0A8C5GH67_GOUWI